MPFPSTVAAWPSSAVTFTEVATWPGPRTTGSPSTSTPSKRTLPSSSSVHAPDFWALKSAEVCLRTWGGNSRGFSESSFATSRPDSAAGTSVICLTFTSLATSSLNPARPAEFSETTVKVCSGCRTRSLFAFRNPCAAETMSRISSMVATSSSSAQASPSTG